MSDGTDVWTQLPVPHVEILEDGFALCDLELRCRYFNPKFKEWFEAMALGLPLAEIVARVAELDTARVLKRLTRRGHYDIDIDDTEARVGKPLLFTLSFRQITWHGQGVIAVHARDNSRLKEKDTIIGSHTRALEIGNREFMRKTRQLEEKNDQLTALSSKLGKYLSPQVYQSIFSGENQVRVETYHKRLTVFFSDIQGFTELTDSLDPSYWPACSTATCRR